jgi:hypothetical protein
MLGTIHDISRRLRKRQDNQHFRNAIDTARTRIFDRGISLASKVVDGFLKATSWVPVRVSCLLCSTAKAGD